MAYEVRERGGKYHVVDTDTQKIRGSYEDEDSAEDRKDELDFRATVRDRMSRMPVTQMTAEEKAAEYDRLMAEKAKAAATQTDPKLPPKKEETIDPPKKKRSGYWGDQLED